MSGADPWTGSKMPGARSPRLADAASPSPPVTAAGVTVGALRAAAAAGEIGESDRVVVLVTGTGLKTPQLIDARPGTEIDADVDVLLEGLGVA